MTAQTIRHVDPTETLTKAFLNAGQALGMTRTELGQVVGRDRTSLARGIDPDAKPGELALMLIRCYRGLYALVGGEPEAMRHWMHTPNRHVQGVPVDLVQTVSGLNRVLDYLDAMRGKV